MTEADHMRGQLETLETVYADLTHGRALVTAQDGPHSTFADGATSKGLPDAVAQGKALTRFAVNQLRQHV